ncbi:DUF1836 domain-containing protein [Oceanobacillus sp. J11TS1]|uniref:DUF1836 domain-containing protein n=1 Tax=Oceanobacillus sp. J11TS1 TaxID=2807191 RepID=UPI001B0EFD55|nr:DUF1836 domain-containing protein [Oceanobacillus sp. J11TS1]GIO23736.1 hypothetical protein J11TS1_23170 [Oceanobacillus sp. J11TS1]
MDIQKQLEDLHLENQLSAENIPDLDLYMDQVIQLFESKFASSKRYEEDKVLTKTMINNYAKAKLFFPIKNKKYSKEHLLIISMIYQMKSVLSMKDIGKTFEGINHRIQEDELDLENFYNNYIQLMDRNVVRFKEYIKEQEEIVEKELDTNVVNDTYLQQVLLITSLTGMSNFYRRAAEKLIDQLEMEGEKEQ